MEENIMNPIEKPEEGDYCRYHFEIIKKMSDGRIICDVCNINCPHSRNEERNYLIKKKA